MKRTRGEYLHPRNLVKAGNEGLEIDKNDPTVLRMNTGGMWDYVKLPVELENFHVQNDFGDPSDVDPSDRWLKDNLEVGSGEEDLALTDRYAPPEYPWGVNAEMRTGDVTGDYIAYQSRYENMYFWPVPGQAYAMPGMEMNFVAAIVNFGIAWQDEGETVLPGRVFVGWTEDITNPGTGEEFSFNNGLGWLIEDGEIYFISKVDGDTAFEHKLVNVQGAANEKLLRLGFAWDPFNPNVLRLQSGSYDAPDNIKPKFEPAIPVAVDFVDKAIPGGTRLKTTIALQTGTNKNVSFLIAYYKFLASKYFVS